MDELELLKKDWKKSESSYPKLSYNEIYEKLHLKSFLYVTQAIHYLIIAVFIYLFYKNYKAISVTDSTNLLMQKILKNFFKCMRKGK